MKTKKEITERLLEYVKLYFKNIHNGCSARYADRIYELEFVLDTNRSSKSIEDKYSHLFIKTNSKCHPYKPRLKNEN